MTRPHRATHRTTGRRRRSKAFAAAAAAGLAAAAAFVAWTALRREKDVYAKDAGAGFDLRETAPSAEAALVAPSRPAPVEPAVAERPAPASSLLAPIPLDGMAGARRSPPAGPRPPLVTRKAERWARAHRVFAAFLKAPARMLAGRSARMASPRAFQAFLADPGQVDAYLDSPLVRVALNSPAVTKALLADPGVAKAFLGSPAMRDPATVKALLASKLFKKLIDCPGPQGALEDPSAITGLASNPATLKWLGENPGALRALAQAAPALAAAYAPKLKTRR